MFSILALVAAASPSIAIGADLPDAVRARIVAHLDQVDVDGAVAIGDVPAVRALIPASDVASLPDEGFIVRTGVVDGTKTIAGDGKGRGKSYAAYAVLEALGFRFLHPLAPTAPALTPERKEPSAASPSARSAPPRAQVAIPDVDDRESPALKIRNIHLHTMHPLELTDLLEGWPMDDERAWAKRLGEWDSFLEWLLANRQNEVEWVLLESDSWRDFAHSGLRANRLRILVDRAHSFGIRAGIDAPIALRQQHAFRLLDVRGSPDLESRIIEARVDWLISIGFDFISTESGDTEITHPDAKRMLAWMNALTVSAAKAHRDVRIKVHCSAGQRADGFVDVHTGKALDFNYLPLFADARLAVEPHTVEPFALDDEAPTYGNRDFRALRQFIVDAEGRRPVIWHPESAYWVSVDVDVPLFLPLYARARLRDFDVLANDGALAGLDGQSLFSSGWEWGYWLNDVVAARAAWRRPSDLRASLAPLIGDALAAEVTAIADDEHALLIDKKGLGSIIGRDAFDDVFDAVGFPPSQPGPTANRALLVEMERSFARHADALRAIATARPDDDVAREFAAAMRVTALRARHVRALHDHDLVSAEAARTQAARIVADAELHYRVPLARIASWRKNPTAYDFGYLASVHDLAYWRRDELRAAGGGLCVENNTSPASFVFGDGALDSFLHGAQGLLSGTPLDGLAQCLAAERPATEPLAK